MSGTLAVRPAAVSDVDNILNLLNEYAAKNLLLKRSREDLLEKLKNRDLSLTEPKPVRRKAFNYDEAEAPLVVAKTEPVRETTEDIANEIEQNITRLMDIEEPIPVEEKPAPMDSTMKFSNLQFGNNYDPTNG